MSSKKTSSARKPKRAKSKKNSTLSLIFGSSPFRVLLATVLTFLTTLVAIWAIDSARFEGKVARNVSVSGYDCLLYTSPSPRDMRRSRMPSSA